MFLLNLVLLLFVNCVNYKFDFKSKALNRIKSIRILQEASQNKFDTIEKVLNEKPEDITYYLLNQKDLQYSLFQYIVIKDNVSLIERLMDLDNIEENFDDLINSNFDDLSEEKYNIEDCYDLAAIYKASNFINAFLDKLSFEKRKKILKLYLTPFEDSSMSSEEISDKKIGFITLLLSMTSEEDKKREKEELEQIVPFVKKEKMPTDPDEVKEYLIKEREKAKQIEEALTLAIEDGNVEAATKLINTECSAPIDKDKLFILSAEKNKTEISKLLIKAGADVNATNDKKETALIWASNNGNDKVVEVLIKAGADVNVADNDRATPLIFASKKGYFEVVEVLIKAGANVNAVTSGYCGGQTALMLAAKNGHDKVVDLLIKAGVDVNAKENDGWTALRHAKYDHHFKVVDLLIKAGAV